MFSASVAEKNIEAEKEEYVFSFQDFQSWSVSDVAKLY
jgi:hypothetical protein